MSQSRSKFESTMIASRRSLVIASLGLAFGAFSLSSGQVGLLAAGQNGLPTVGKGDPLLAGTSGQFTPLNLPVVSAIQRSSLVSATSLSQVVHLAVNLQSSNPAGLQAYADSVSSPTSANFRKFITPSQVGQMFGQPTSTVQNLVAYFKQQGFTIKLVAQDQMAILMDGTVAQAEAAFNTTINNYKTNNPNDTGRSEFYANSKPPQLPAALAPSILSIEGLQNFTKPHPMLNPLTCTQTRVLYDSAPIYNASFQGQNRHVAISSWDGYRLTNVPLYYSTFALPTPTGGVGSNITVVTIDGGSGSGTAEGEGDVDIQMVLGMAPLTNFTIYDGGGGLTDVLTREEDDNTADIISESYGWDLDTATAEAAHNIHLAMTTQGITYMCACGDSGTTLEPYAYPDDDGEVMVVGGTQANFTSSGARISEPCWSNGGGGWATDPFPFNVLQSWQKGTGVPTSLNFRLVPDLAFNAAGNGTGAYQFYYNGSLNFDYDGTSFASPVFAGMLTIGEQKLISLGGLPSAPHRFGRLQDVIYAQDQRSDVWFDVVQGSNGQLPNGQFSVAARGWDFTSGWGCMDVNAFVASQEVTPPTVWDAASAQVFLNTEASPAIQEGVFEGGTAASLNAVDGNSFIVKPVPDGSLGEVASVKATYNTSVTASNVANLSITFEASAPAAATVSIYVLDYKTGVYTLLKSLSGTQAGVASTIPISLSPLGSYVGPSGQVTVVARSLVPVSKEPSVGLYTFQVNEMVLSGAASITN